MAEHTYNSSAGDTGQSLKFTDSELQVYLKKKMAKGNRVRQTTGVEHGHVYMYTCSDAALHTF